MAKRGYFDLLKTGEAHDTYDVAKEGLGSRAEWQSAFNVRMGFAEAKARKASRGWGSDFTILSDLSGFHVDDKSVWSDIKKAWKKAAMANNFNFNRQSTSNPNGVTEAESKIIEQRFMDAQAAYTMLEDIYRIEGKLS